MKAWTCKLSFNRVYQDLQPVEFRLLTVLSIHKDIRAIKLASQELKESKKWAQVLEVHCCRTFLCVSELM